jgi:hypothetical protein
MWGLGPAGGNGCAVSVSASAAMRAYGDAMRRPCGCRGFTSFVIGME